MNESKKGNYKLRNWSFELKLKQIKKNVSNLSFSNYILLIYIQLSKKKEKKRKKKKKNQES